MSQKDEKKVNKINSNKGNSKPGKANKGVNILGVEHKEPSNEWDITAIFTSHINAAPMSIKNTKPWQVENEKVPPTDINAEKIKKTKKPNKPNIGDEKE